MGTIVYGTGHVKTSQGIIKIAEIIACVIGLILVTIDGYKSDLLNAYVVGTAAGLIVSLLLLILYVTKAARPIQGFVAFQLYLHFVLFIYILIVAAILLSKNYPDKYKAAGGFGIFAAVLYLLDAIDCYRLDPTPVACLR